MVSVDADEQAVAWARSRLDLAAFGTRVRCIAGRAEDVPSTLPEPEVVVVSPPRAGLHWDFVLWLTGHPVSRMAYISRNVFGRVIACDPYLIDGDFPAYVQRAELNELCEQSDVVSLHTPLTAETRGMINAGVLAWMRPGSYLVNTARGAVVNIDDLLSALDSGILAGAGLDVLPVEPVPSDSRLLDHPKVILTPHAAFFSVEAEVELRRKAAQNIVSWLESGRPDYVVVQGSRSPAA